MSALSPSAECVAEYSQRNKRAAGWRLTDRTDRQRRWQSQLRFCYGTSVSLLRLKATFPLPSASLSLFLSLCLSHATHTRTTKQTNHTADIRVGRLRRVRRDVVKWP